MQRKFVHKCAIAFVALLVVGVGIMSFQLMAKAQQNGRVPVKGQTVPLISHARLLGTASGSQQLHLSIGLQPRNQQELNTLLYNLYDSRSSLYHHFLSPQEFVDEFGPTPQQQQQDRLRQNASPLGGQPAGPGPGGGGPGRGGGRGG